MEELQRNGHITSPTPSQGYSVPSSSGGALPYSAPQQASPYSSPARRQAPPPPTYQAGGSAVGYSAPAPTQNQPWRPYGPPGGNMPMPTLGSYPQ